MTSQAPRARCRRCEGEFSLYELREREDGLCPRCQMPLSPDWTHEVLAWARHAEDLQCQFVNALRRLVGFPGNLDLIPGSVLGPILDEVGWEQDLAFEPEDAIASGALLESRAARWERSAVRAAGTPHGASR